MSGSDSGKPNSVKLYLNPVFKQRRKACDDKNELLLGYLLETTYVMQGWGHIQVGY